MSRPGSSRLLLAGLAAVLLLGGAAAAQERVGVSSGVNPAASGTPPGQATRQLVIGQDVVFNERIATTESGQTQLLFLDESSMSIGPNSDLTIDQFVYDPRSGTGKLAMTTTKGLLRFVGGKLSKQDAAVTMRTNSATLAVRGGAFLLDQSPAGALQAVFIYGRGLTVTGTTGATQTLQRPGFAVTIAGPGAAPSAPFPVPPAQLAQLVSRLDGRRGATGGARTVPTEQTVAASGISQTISENLIPVQPLVQPSGVNVASIQSNLQVQNSVNPGSCLGLNNCPNQFTTTAFQTGGFGGVVKFNAFSTFGPDQTSPDNVPFTGGAVSNGTFSANLGSQGTISFPVTPGQTLTFSSTGTSPNGGGPVSGTSFLTQDGSYLYANVQSSTPIFVSAGQAVPSSVLASTGQTRVFAYNLPQSQTFGGGTIPFSPSDDGVPSNAAISPYLIVAPANNAIGAATGPTARTLQASIGFTGTGPSQSSTAVVQTGAIGQLQSSGAPVIGGLIRGVETDIPTPTGSESLFADAASLIDAKGNSLYGKSTISGFALDQTRISGGPGNNVVNTKTSSSGNEIEGVSVSSLAFPGPYGFAQPAVATTVPTGLGASRTSQTLSGYFGGQMATSATTPAFNSYPIAGTATVATDATQNSVAATFTSAPLVPSATGGINSVVMNFGDSSPNNPTRSAFIDDATFGAVESKTNPQQINGQNLVVNGDTTQASRLYFVSANTAPPPTSLLPPGASYCQCQFLQWGYWGGDLLTGTQTDNTISRIDHGHINFWVAGVPTPMTDLNTLASQGAVGNYSGHAIGSVVNNGSSYVAAGGFNATYNFGTQNANFAISNFDGKSFASGNVRVPLNGANYSTTFGGIGSLNGSFYGQMAAETGGNFAISGISGVPNYSAAGIFAGKR
ncbi:MAG TPA: FecR domain-containing protein [Stellaceae bacterium]